MVTELVEKPDEEEVDWEIAEPPGLSNCLASIERFDKGIALVLVKPMFQFVETSIPTVRRSLPIRMLGS